jgi:hypothetical protein
MATCRDCGLDDLEWIETEWGYVLFAEDVPHVCGAFRRFRAVQAFYRGLYDLREAWKKAA